MSAVCLVAFVAGCSSSGGGDTAAFCDATERYAQSVQAASGADYLTPEMDDALADADASMDDMRASAPDDIAAALATLNDTDPESIRLSEQAAYDDAQSAANTHIAEACDLDVSL